MFRSCYILIREALPEIRKNQSLKEETVEYGKMIWYSENSLEEI